MSIDPRFLNCRFHRRLRWEREKGGAVVVFRPRFGEGRFGRRLASLLRLDDYRIRLDEIGSLVWTCCDDRTPAAEIADRLRNNFGEKVEPADQRLYEFIMQMTRANMINVIPPERKLKDDR